MVEPSCFKAILAGGKGFKRIGLEDSPAHIDMEAESRVLNFFLHDLSMIFAPKQYLFA